MGQYTNNFDKKLKITSKSRYQREQYQSYMTTPEWRNVEMVEEYGAFLKTGKSMFQFPYFGQLFDLWRIFFNSFRQARKRNSFFEIFTSEYMVMDVFVNTFTMLELFPRGILALFLRPFLKKENPTEVQTLIANYYIESAERLKTIPFYDHDYQKMRADLIAKYQACKNKTWGDWFSFKCLSLELIFRGWISTYLSRQFHQEGSETPSTTDILVKLNVKNNDPELAKKAMLSKLEKANLKVVDQHLYAKDKNPKKDYTSVYACVAAPRYMAFKDTIAQLSKEDIKVKKIAGCDHVQVKLVVASNAKLTTFKPLYSYTDRINQAEKTVLVDVPVRDLQQKVTEFSKTDGVKQVRFIHNF